ncbi:Uncharacterised protein [Vibrio cholerae]|nr:Uncharacterised protein [Vibrio cholerae]
MSASIPTTACKRDSAMPMTTKVIRPAKANSPFITKGVKWI